MSFLWIYNAVFLLLTAAWNASLFSSTVKTLFRQVILYSTCFFPLNIQHIFSGVRALFSAQAYLLIEGDFIWSTSVKLMELRSAKISELEEKWESYSTRLNVSDLHSKNFSHPLYFHFICIDMLSSNMIVCTRVYSQCNLIEKGVFEWTL